MTNQPLPSSDDDPDRRCGPKTGGRMSDQLTGKQIMRGCRHFTGLDKPTCAAGHFYTGLPDHFPCWPNRMTGQIVGECPSRAWYTPEEIEEEERQRNEAVQKWLEDLENDICPHCGAKIEKRVQVGRCVYARPCGCRLYQGRLDGGDADE